MVGSTGPLATINREPGQVRKEAAVAVTLCAGVWLVEFASIYKGIVLCLTIPLSDPPISGIRTDRLYLQLL